MSYVTRRASAAAVALCAALIAGPAYAAPKALDLVFYGTYLSKLDSGATLSYRFARDAKDPKLEKSFEDDVKLRVAPKGQETSVIVDLFTGERAYSVGPIARSGNPVVIAVLENDVREMQKVLGGSPYYIRNRMMEALQGDPPVEAVKVDYDGRQVDAWKITLKPFENDKNKDKLGDYAKRTYEIVFSEGVPGGLYALKSVTPKEGAGEPLLVEELKIAADAGAAAGNEPKEAEKP